MLCGRGPSSHPSWPARACPPELLEENGAEEGGEKDKEVRKHGKAFMVTS